MLCKKEGRVGVRETTRVLTLIKNTIIMYTPSLRMQHFLTIDLASS
jgi:hypothetical protein